MSIKAAIYCRLSEEDKNKPSASDDSCSIQNQKSMLLQYAIEQGWEIYGIYSDDDYTGADRHRPEFNRLLEDARQHRFDIILCKTQSRFTRELELVEKYIHGLFPVWGIRFVSIVDHADTSNKGNKKSRQINGLVNEWYLEDMSENIRSVLTSRRINGFHIGAFALYGYQKDPDRKGHLIIDEEAAAVVREVFTLFAQGYGKTAIARMLNDRGIPNPTEYKRLHGLRYQQPKSRNSTLWKYYAISAMLTNEMYIGNMVQGRYGSVSYKTKQIKPRPKEEWYIVEGTHEPIIDRELWDQVQTLAAQKAKPFLTGTIGLFAGKTCCADCGYTMRSSKSHGRCYLKCPTRHVAKDACAGSFISVSKLEQIVLRELNSFLDEYLDKDALAQKMVFSSSQQKQEKQLRSELAHYKKKTAEYTQAIRKLYLDHSRCLISESDLAQMYQEFTAERERLSRMATDTEKLLAEIEEKTTAEDEQERLKQYKAYTHLEHLTREIVEMLIDHICVGKRISGTGDVPVEIYWNF